MIWMRWITEEQKECAMLGLPFQEYFAEEVVIGERSINGTQLKWSVFHDFPADRMYSVIQEWVFPFIKTLHSNKKNSAYSKYMDDAIFKLPTPLLLSKVVDSLDMIYSMMNESQAVDGAMFMSIFFPKSKNLDGMDSFEHRGILFV